MQGREHNVSAYMNIIENIKLLDLATLVAFRGCYISR